VWVELGIAGLVLIKQVDPRDVGEAVECELIETVGCDECAQRVGCDECGQRGACDVADLLISPITRK
jgi:hypothetical protein